MKTCNCINDTEIYVVDLFLTATAITALLVTIVPPESYQNILKSLNFFVHFTAMG